MEPIAIVGMLTVALGASFTSGINVYATVATLGLMHRYVDGFALPGDLAVLGSHWVIWPAAIMYTVEFFADKVPGLDTAWDTIHTFIRVPAGAVIAAAALGDVPFEVQMGAAVVGGTLALGAHTAKATTRLAAHGTGTSPLVSPTASVIEDVAVVGLIGLIVAYPVIAGGVIFLLVLGTFIFLWMAWRTARAAFRALFGGGRPTVEREFPRTRTAPEVIEVEARVA